MCCVKGKNAVKGNDELANNFLINIEIFPKTTGIIKGQKLKQLSFLKALFFLHLIMVQIQFHDLNIMFVFIGSWKMQKNTLLSKQLVIYFFCSHFDVIIFCNLFGETTFLSL